MIVSKPKRGTIFSLGIVTIVVISGLFYAVNKFQGLESPETWRYIIIAVLLVTASLLLHKLLFNYKVLKIGDNKFHVYYPFRFFKTVQELKDLGAWQETIINTNKTEFRQLKIVFLTKGYVKISNQENSEYDKVIKYLKKKAPKKEVKQDD